MKLKKRALTAVIAVSCILGLGAVSGSGILIYKNTSKLYTFKPVTDDAPAYITAHTGAYGTADNSLESVSKAVEMGADIAEVDVRMAEGVLYIAHDGIEKGKSVNDYPTLREVFSIIKNGGIRVNCDLKEDNLITPVINLAKEMDMEELIIFTGNASEKELKTFIGQSNEFSVYLNLIYFGEPYFLTRKISDDIVKKVLELKPHFADVGVNLSYKDVTKVFYNTMKDNGINISVYTVKKAKILNRLKEYDLYNITVKI